jgi:hypothetical protein
MFLYRQPREGSALRLSISIKRFAPKVVLVAAFGLLTHGGAGAAIVQRDGLRISVLSQILPYKLPRTTTAPIAVFIAGHIATSSGAIPPQLQRMTIKVNRHGLLQSAGLPTCRLSALKATSTDRALAHCADALVGSGRFWATIVLPEQRPYPTRGRLLVFNGRKAGGRVLFAHIYTSKPFDSSFVITFAIEHVDDGPYGTQLSASLPQALGSWGFVDRIKLTLRRKYSFRGRHRSYFNASCPAPAGVKVASFPLALASFEFSEDRRIALQVPKTCGVKE